MTQVLAACAFLAGNGAGVAAAAGAEEWQVSTNVAYASVRTGDSRPSGALIGIDVQYGLGDTWAARLSVSSSWHPVSAGGEGPAGIVRATAVTTGLTYAVDTLQVIPVLEVGIGLLDVGGAAATPHRDLGLQLGLGADYLLSRRWAVGGLLRYQHFPVALSGGNVGSSADAALAWIGLRGSVIF